MTFDPKKPFGTVHGLLEEFPTAKFEQGGRLYDISKQELTGGKSKGLRAPDLAPPPPPSLSDQIAAITKKLDSAKNKLKAKPSPGRRLTVTKLEGELETLVGNDED